MSYSIPFCFDFLETIFFNRKSSLLDLYQWISRWLSEIYQVRKIFNVCVGLQKPLRNRPETLFLALIEERANNAKGIFFFSWSRLCFVLSMDAWTIFHGLANGVWLKNSHSSWVFFLSRIYDQANPRIVFGWLADENNDLIASKFSIP